MYEDLHVVVCVSSDRWIYGVKPTLIPQRPAGALVTNDADTSLLDNQRPAGERVTNDADLLFTWQPAPGRGAGYQRRWFTIYLTTSARPGAGYQRRWYICTWQPAPGRVAGYQRRWFTIYLTTSARPERWLPTTLIYYLLDNQLINTQQRRNYQFTLYLDKNKLYMSPMWT